MAGAQHSPKCITFVFEHEAVSKKIITPINKTARHNRGGLFYYARASNCNSGLLE
jgi:hypothetical protein